ncbi:putative toxin-antitoxin system antitoxin component (TIGR02293 family) [Erwinia toletana]|uniref:Toxin-antitoxin system antitoxin component (TIGR02293 family) n=1 Tax=Winslowiella toletana TaxID=92490 RepID=A0ABS4P3T5_9GAMM|nr:antitoxin Xre/MbcA/ParS toxin-binding domain-containing protein [Winslowiella toletana]MBP2167315.1 putative toxin-antitoxin system antitoxin component (TIGR02293 family) [Winslowiella toletana]
MKTYSLPLKTETPASLWVAANLPDASGPELRGLMSLGLQVGVIDNIRDIVGFKKEEFLATLGLSARSIARRKDRLSPIESESITRYVTAFDLALSMFNNDYQKTINWMDTPARVLGGETPNQAMKTETGARDVMSLIEGIKHGVVM